MKIFDGLSEVILTVNGETRTVAVRPQDTLLRTLRETLGYTGAKASCENGDCGACTILADGIPVKSCIALTVDAADREITTIEGLTEPSESTGSGEPVGSPLQKAFVEENGFQCGFCTPGQIMNATALLARQANPADSQIREYMESNLCRCTGYEGIERAVRSAVRSANKSPNKGANKAAAE